MTGIDTNVLVRFLIEDDRRQTERVHRLFTKSRNAGERVYISAIVLCEAVWVLRSAFAKSRSDIQRAIEELVSTDVFQVEEEDCVRAAVKAFAAGQGDFSDCFIGQMNLARGCRTTITFDRRLRRCAGFTVL